MCLAVPVRIVKIDAESATVEMDGIRRPCNVSFIPDAQAGDWVLVHAGFAIQKWSEEDVREYNEMMADIENNG